MPKFQQVSALGIKQKDNICKVLANLGNNVILNMNAVQLLGLPAAALLAELVAEYNQWDTLCELDSDYGFYSTVDKLKSRLNFSQERQKQLIDKLVEGKLLHVAYKGIPPKRYIYLHLETIYKLYAGEKY